MPTRTEVVHVIDDEEVVRDSLAFVLECEDFEVHTYDSATAFLTTVPPEVHGCIVTDIRMPGMSGIEMICRLRAMGVMAPVIAITGHADAALVANAIKSGAVDCVLKPFVDDRLLSTIRSTLRDAAARGH